SMHDGNQAERGIPLSWNAQLNRQSSADRFQLSRIHSHKSEPRQGGPFLKRSPRVLCLLQLRSLHFFQKSRRAIHSHHFHRVPFAFCRDECHAACSSSEAPCLFLRKIRVNMSFFSSPAQHHQVLSAIHGHAG